MKALRKFIILASIFTLIMFIACGRDEGEDSSWYYPIPTYFVYKTPQFGIEVAAEKETTEQFKSYYGYAFEEVNWEKIDDFFFKIAEFHGLAEEVTFVKEDPNNPSNYISTTERKLYVSTQLRIIIEKWDPTCIDEIPGSKEMRVNLPGWGLICIDGAFLYNLAWPQMKHTILIHLGDDDGRGSDAFCHTALDWELGHYMLYALGDPCWMRETLPECIEKRPSSRDLGLCEEQEPVKVSIYEDETLIPIDYWEVEEKNGKLWLGP